MENVLHISGAQSIPPAKFEAQTLEDFQKIIAEQSVDYVMYYFGGMPRRGTTAEKAIPHLKRLIRNWQIKAQHEQIPAPYVPSDVDLSDLIAD
jgi:hypothetical protein